MELASPEGSGAGHAAVRQRLTPWLEAQVNSQKFPGLKWMDKAERIFRITWKHASRADWIEQDALIFKEWALYTGRYREGVDQPDWPTWKTRFRCALNKSPDVKELKEQRCEEEANPYRIYKFIDRKRQGSPSPPHQNTPLSVNEDSRGYGSSSTPPLRLQQQHTIAVVPEVLPQAQSLNAESVVPKLEDLMTSISSDLQAVSISELLNFNSGNMSLTNISYDSNITSNLVSMETDSFKEGARPMATKQEYVPSNQDYVPSNQDYVPSNQDYVPSNQDYVPSNQDYVPSNQDYGHVKQEHVPGNQEFVPGNNEFVSRNLEYVPRDFPGNREFVPGNQNYVPGNQDLMPVHQNYLPIKQEVVPKTEDSFGHYFHPDIYHMKLTVRFRDQVIQQLTVTNPHGCRLYHSDVMPAYWDDTLYGDQQAIQIPLSLDLNLINEEYRSKICQILQATERGVNLFVEQGNIYIERRCQTSVFTAPPNLDQKRTVKVERQGSALKIFDYQSAFRPALGRFWQGLGPRPSPQVVLSFGQNFAPDVEPYQELLLSVTVCHVLADSLLDTPVPDNVEISCSDDLDHIHRCLTQPQCV